MLALLLIREVILLCRVDSSSWQPAMMQRIRQGMSQETAIIRGKRQPRTCRMTHSKKQRHSNAHLDNCWRNCVGELLHKSLDDALHELLDLLLLAGTDWRCVTHGFELEINGKMQKLNGIQLNL